MVKKMQKYSAHSLLILIAAVFVMPAVIVAMLSLKDGIKPYIDFFIWEPAYLKALAVSMRIAFLSSLGTVAVSILAAYVFSQMKFKGRGALFYLYIIVMMTPFQVTLLPQYMVSKFFGIYDTEAALILPGIFTPFAAFLLTQIMKSVPKDSIEAARLDTDSTLRIILKVILPQIKSGIICAWILVFTEQWNAVAEPLILLETEGKYPLSVLLSNAPNNEFGFAATVAFMILPLGMFIIFEDAIMKGLEGYRLK